MYQQVTVSLSLLIKKLMAINLSQNLPALTITLRNPLNLPPNIFFFYFTIFICLMSVYLHIIKLKNWMFLYRTTQLNIKTACLFPSHPDPK